MYEIEVKQNINFNNEKKLKTQRRIKNKKI